MLVRAYRLTDKIGLAVLKSGAGLGSLGLEGMQALIQLLRQSGGGMLAVILGVLLQIASVIAALLGWIWRGVRRVFLLLFGVTSAVTRRAARGSGKVSGRARTTAVGAAGDAMARRAARAEMDATLVEDPLRAQNRILSLLVVGVLAVLLVVVIVITGSGNRGAAPVIGGGDNLNVQDSPATAQPGIAQLSTPVPTATQLPEILQVRGSLAFVARENGQTDIWAVSVGGRTPIRLTNHPADDRDPAWSPDGRRLAFASRRDGNWDIYIYDLPTDEVIRMTYDLSFQGRPTWSPDGAFIAYESYQGNNLDIFVLSVTDATIAPQRLPSSSNAPDFSPAWSPDGRRIAFVSWRDGNQDIYIFDLDTLETTNVTNTPNRHEDFPAWSPDGAYLAYSALDQGIDKVFVQSMRDVNAPPEVFRAGRQPAWSPDGNSIVFAVNALEGTQFIVAPYTGVGTATDITAVPLPASQPAWTGSPLPAALVNAGGLPPAITQPLYIEQVTSLGGDPPYGLGSLPNVRGPEFPNLSDRVNDSFNALRARVNQEAGRDFLGQLEHALWDLDYRPQPGEERRNWHMTGRAFSFNRNLLLGFPAEVEVVREDTDLVTYWRVYVRVADEAQSGQLGEPLRHMPWAFVSSAQGDVEAYDQGGRLQTQMPSGYYIDLTQIAQDYGWERMPAGSDWRANVFSRNYWMFRKTDGLTWLDAMRELYTQGQLGGFWPTPTPPPAQGSGG